MISPFKIVTAAHCFGIAAANVLKRKRFGRNSGSYKVDAGGYTTNGYQFKFRIGFTSVFIRRNLRRDLF